LSQLHNLQRLRLGNHLARYDTFALAGQLSQLQSLIFEYADDSAASHADVAPLVASRSLQELQLCNAACSDELLGVLARIRVNKLTLHAGRFCASRKGAAALAQQLQSLQLRVNDADLRLFAGALPAFQALNSLTLSVHRASGSCAELMQVRAAVCGVAALVGFWLLWAGCLGDVSTWACSFQHHAQRKYPHQHRRVVSRQQSARVLPQLVAAHLHVVVIADDLFALSLLCLILTSAWLLLCCACPAGYLQPPAPAVSVARQQLQRHQGSRNHQPASAAVPAAPVP
jgi:hypothetical protein